MMPPTKNEALVSQRLDRIPLSAIPDAVGLHVTTRFAVESALTLDHKCLYWIRPVTYGNRAQRPNFSNFIIMRRMAERASP